MKLFYKFNLIVLELLLIMELHYKI